MKSKITHKEYAAALDDIANSVNYWLITHPYMSIGDKQSWEILRNVKGYIKEQELDNSLKDPVVVIGNDIVINTKNVFYLELVADNLLVVNDKQLFFRNAKKYYDMILSKMKG